MSDEAPTAEGRVVRAPVRTRSGAIAEAVRRLTERASGSTTSPLRRPTLDDVFLTLTGHAAEEQPPERRGGRPR